MSAPRPDLEAVLDRLLRRAKETARKRGQRARRAALTSARALRAHVADGLARGSVETVLSGARCLEYLVGLAGPTVAAQAFRAARQRPSAN